MQTQKLISEVFEYPTAPFREAYISNQVQKILKQKKIPFYLDKFGNVVAGVKTPTEFKSHKGLVFLAHMDHPGFHVKKQKFVKGRTHLEVDWLGGAPFKKMLGSRVRVHDPENKDVRTGVIGIVSKVTQPKPGSRERRMNVVIDRKVNFSKKAFGAFAYPAAQVRGSRLSGRVCDDLTGVALCLAVLIDTKNSKNVVSVFTRAEEVGFVGCWGQLSANAYPKNAYFISLEASKHLPNARLGKGPVIREGDRSTLFDSTLTRYIQQVAEKLKSSKSNFKYQMRRLDGGSCEATAIDLFGYRATGISLPLQNYHNEAQTKPGPEIIDLKDFENLRTLNKALVQLIALLKTSDAKIMKRLNQNYNHFKNKFYELRSI